MSDEFLPRGPDGRSTDIESGHGVPAWMAATLRHCSRCGAALNFGPIEGEDRHRLACDNCGFIAYVNPRLVVTTIPVTDDGDVILLRRGIEPGYGGWAQPGGFLEVDETVTEGAIRETLEETGLDVQPGEIIGLYSRLEAAVVVIAFEAHVVGGSFRPNPEAIEIAAFAPAEIPWPGIRVRARRDPLARHRLRHQPLGPHRLAPTPPSRAQGRAPLIG